MTEPTGRRPTSTSTSSSSARASVARCRRCGSPRRATGCSSSRPGAGSRTRTSRGRRGTCAALPLGASARAVRHPAHPPAARTSSSSPARASAAAPSTTPAPSTCRRRRSTATRSGATSPTGRPSSRRTTRRRRRMLGVVTNPCEGPVEQVMRRTAEDLGVGDTFRKTPVGIYFGPPGERVARPLLRRRGPGPHRLHAVRQLHGRLPGRGQEHPREELPRPGRAARRGRRAAAHRDAARRACRAPVAGRPGEVYRVLHERTGPRGGREVRVTTARHVVVAAGTWGTQQLLHAMQDEGELPRLSRAARPPHPHQLRGARSAPPRSRAPEGRRPHPRCRDHVLLPSRRRTPTSRTAATARGPTPWALLAGVRVPATAPAARGSRRRSSSSSGIPATSVPWGSTPTGGASAPSSASSCRPATTPCARRAGRARSAAAGSRRAQGHGEPEPHATSRRATPRCSASRPGSRRRPVSGRRPAAPGGGAGHAHDGALPRRRRDRRDSRAWGARPVPPGLGPPGRLRRRRAAVSANLGVNPALTITAQAERAMSLWPNRGEPDRPSVAGASRMPCWRRCRRGTRPCPGLLRVPVLRTAWPRHRPGAPESAPAHHVVSVAGVTMEP